MWHHWFVYKQIFFKMAKEHVGCVYMPGDVLENLTIPENSKKIILGPGLVAEGESTKVSKPGILRYRDPGVYWIDSHQKRVGLKS